MKSDALPLIWHGCNASINGGDASINGGNASTYGGNASTNGGNASTNGVNASTNGGNAYTNGGNAATNGGNASNYGGNASTYGGNASTNGAGVMHPLKFHNIFLFSHHKNYAQFRFVWWFDTGHSFLPISFRVASLALGQSHDCPSASEVTLKDMGKLTK